MLDSAQRVTGIQLREKLFIPTDHFQDRAAYPEPCLISSVVKKPITTPDRCAVLLTCGTTRSNSVCRPTMNARQKAFTTFATNRAIPLQRCRARRNALARSAVLNRD